MIRFMFVSCIAFGFMACRTCAKQSATDVETVGTLSASPTHVYVAPVHATTDLTPAGFVGSGDITDTHMADVAPTGDDKVDKTPKEAHGF